MDKKKKEKLLSDAQSETVESFIRRTADKVVESVLKNETWEWGATEVFFTAREHFDGCFQKMAGEPSSEAAVEIGAHACCLMEVALAIAVQAKVFLIAQEMTNFGPRKN